ncbi:MAG: SDR family oxidoreductase [Sulfitobacter sp.]
MDYKIKGKKAVVMGASQGLGKAIALALAAEGVTVAVMARSKDKLEKLASEINGVAVAADLSKRENLIAALQEARETIGDPDIVVINTGGPPKATFLEADSDGWREQTEKLFHFTIDTIYDVLPAMRKQKWGRIMVVTSISAQEPEAGLSYSSALRAGLHGLINDVSRDVAEDGVTVNAIMPGLIKTDRVIELNMQIEDFRGKIPARRFGHPEEFASLACYLASEQASYLTGQAIATDGGYLKGI